MKKNKWNDNKNRCAWVSNDPIDIGYHDHEWGVPIFDDRKLFEFLILEGAQAGLSWITVLKKREAYHKAFNNFDPKKIAVYSPEKINKLLLNPGIIRNRLKINSTITNARAYLEVIKNQKSFSDYIWGFVDGVPIQNHWSSFEQVPVKNEISDRMSKDLKKKGFKFVGSTICYAFMQAVGMVNDHTVDCFCYAKKGVKNGLKSKYR